MILRRRAAQLLRLFDGRHDNPLIRYGRPDRSWPRAAKYWGFIGAAWCVAMVLGLLVDRESSSDAAVVFCVIEVGLLPFLTLGCLYLFGHPLRDPHHLEELHLTTLPRREAAFGAVWWGCAAAAMAFLPFWLTSLLLEVIHLPEDQAIHATGRILLGPLAFFHCLGIAARVWIDHGPRLIATVIRGLLLNLVSLFYLYFLALVLAFGFVFLLARRSYGESWEVLTWTVILGSVLGSGGFWLAAACRFAGNRLFASVDPESLARDSWVANDRLAAKEKNEQRAALGRLWRQRRPDTICDGKGIGVAFGMLLVGAAVGLIRGLTGDVGNPFAAALCGIVGFPSLIAAPVYAIVASLYLRARGRDDTVLPAIAGDIHGTAIVSILLPGLPFLLLAVATTIGELWIINEEIGSWVIVAVLGTTLSLVILGFLMSVATSLLIRGRRRRVAAAWFAAAAFFHLGTLFDLDGTGRDQLLFYDVDDWGMAVYSLTGAAVLLWAALGIYASGQRLFVNELRHLPRHTLTTDPAPAPSNPPEDAHDADSPGAGPPDAEIPEPGPRATDDAPGDPSIRS